MTNILSIGLLLNGTNITAVTNYGINITNESQCVISNTIAKATRGRVRVDTFMVHQFCSCGGTYKPTGVCLTSYPPQYPHQCTKCKSTLTFHEEYPHLETEETKQ